MLNKVMKFFENVSSPESGSAPNTTEHDIRVATCALLVEIARIDQTFSPDELEMLLSILEDQYGLSREHAEALLAEAEKEVKNSVDLWRFTRLVNENYSTEEKIKIIEMLWRIVFVDGKMNRYEHHLMGKLKNLLHLTHDQLIDAKLKVKKAG